MRICVVHNSIVLKGQDSPLVSMIAKLAQQVLRPDTFVDIKPLRRGLKDIRDFMSCYFDFLDKNEVIDRFIKAEEEGYDAVTVDCFGDPGVHEAREILSIPVIGPAESTMLFACLLGRKFGVITLNEPEQVHKIEMQIELHGLQSRTIRNPVRPITMPSRELLSLGYEAPTRLKPVVLEMAKDCVRDGAEAIILGCGGLGPPCVMAGLVKTDKPEVPILDPISVALKTAETTADLLQKLGLPSAARGVLYASPSREDIARVRANFGLEQPRNL